MFNFIKNAHQCVFWASINVKNSKFALKNGVIIDKTKLKTHISKAKFLLKNSLSIALRALVGKTSILFNFLKYYSHRLILENSFDCGLI